MFSSFFYFDSRHFTAGNMFVVYNTPSDELFLFIYLWVLITFYSLHNGLEHSCCCCFYRKNKQNGVYFYGCAPLRCKVCYVSTLVAQTAAANSLEERPGRCLSQSSQPDFPPNQKLFFFDLFTPFFCSSFSLVLPRFVITIFS